MATIFEGNVVNLSADMMAKEGSSHSTSSGERTTNHNVNPDNSFESVETRKQDDSINEWNTVSRRRGRPSLSGEISEGTSQRDGRAPDLGDEKPRSGTSNIAKTIISPFPATSTQILSPALSTTSNSSWMTEDVSGESSSDLAKIDQQSEAGIPPLQPPIVLERDEGADLTPTSRKWEIDLPSLKEVSMSQKGKSPKAQSSNIGNEDKSKVLKLSPAKIEELTSSPKSIPLHALPKTPPVEYSSLSTVVNDSHSRPKGLSFSGYRAEDDRTEPKRQRAGSGEATYSTPNDADSTISSTAYRAAGDKAAQSTYLARPNISPRTFSTPPTLRRKHSASSRTGPTYRHDGVSNRNAAIPLQLNLPRSVNMARTPSALKRAPSPEPVASSMPPSLPMPPLSIPTYLQLELASSRPSPLYIHRSATSDLIYESSAQKFDRILNFLWLPLHLELVLWFGALACLDAWLATFTILPLRFFKALGVLLGWWGQLAMHEAQDIGNFVYWGVGRVWRRWRRMPDSTPPSTLPTPADDLSQSRKGSVSGLASTVKDSDYFSQSAASPALSSIPGGHIQKQSSHNRRHKRTKSSPSTLLPAHKADILKGLVVLCSCMIMMKLDASRMYHGIRGQAAMKLYVIYNVLEVGDRLLSALGQDVFECLFSKETLERKADGRSKLLRPFGMFLLALAYNVIHATALFYQVITLNVAVNSYSNALLTLLMSNQFVEIKSTVFKRFEKENLFQLTCADIVERFQLWLMLLVIASRNLVEMGVGGLGAGLGGTGGTVGNTGSGSNATGSLGGGILPNSFTLLPKWTGQVMGPFVLVLGSEMIVDWLKHAYITKFNSVKPKLYGRFLDVLAKDYYSNAFADQNLTRRLGLPTLPLACLFIRASLQTYQMFVATHIPSPIISTATSLSLEEEAAGSSSPATTAALQHFDNILRSAIGRSSFSGGSSLSWTDDVAAYMAMFIFFLGVFFVLLALKLVLGMVLLSAARARYMSMSKREHVVVDTGMKKIGGWGTVDITEDKRSWIYKDEPETAKRLRERDAKDREKSAKPEVNLDGVTRYAMVAKRIW
jgi:Eukaryotic membrane protein family